MRDAMLSIRFQKITGCWYFLMFYYTYWGRSGQVLRIQQIRQKVIITNEIFYR